MRWAPAETTVRLTPLLGPWDLRFRFMDKWRTVSPVDVLVDRPAGRHLRVRSLKSSGSPVLYFHGTPESCLTIDYQASLDDPPPVYLFAIDRPGYGQSDFAPFDFQSVASDSAAAADALGIDEFAVVGHSGGAPFALATAEILGDRVTSVGLSASPVPYPEVPAAWERLSDVDREASRLAESSAADAAVLFQRDFEPLAMSLGSDIRSVKQYLLAEMPGDATVLSHDAALDAFARSLREGVRQGTAGCAWDNVAWVASWRIDLSRISQRVSIWYGERDELMPPMYGEWLLSRLSNCELIVWRECAHLGLLAHWGDVFGRVATS